MHGEHETRSSRISFQNLKTSDFPRGTGITPVPIFLRHTTVDYVESAGLPFLGPLHTVLWNAEMVQN